MGEELCVHGKDSSCGACHKIRMDEADKRRGEWVQEDAVNDGTLVVVLLSLNGLEQSGMSHYWRYYEGDEVRDAWIRSVVGAEPYLAYTLQVRGRYLVIPERQWTHGFLSDWLTVIYRDGQVFPCIDAVRGEGGYIIHGCLDGRVPADRADCRRMLDGYVVQQIAADEYAVGTLQRRSAAGNDAGAVLPTRAAAAQVAIHGSRNCRVEQSHMTTHRGERVYAMQMALGDFVTESDHTVSIAILTPPVDMVHRRNNDGGRVRYVSVTGRHADGAGGLGLGDALIDLATDARGCSPGSLWGGDVWAICCGGDNDRATDGDLARGVGAAMRLQADVIVIPWWFDIPVPRLRAAVAIAEEKGIMVVTAAPPRVAGGSKDDWQDGVSLTEAVGVDIRGSLGKLDGTGRNQTLGAISAEIPWHNGTRWWLYAGSGIAAVYVGVACAKLIRLARSHDTAWHITPAMIADALDDTANGATESNPKSPQWDGMIQVAAAHALLVERREHAGETEAEAREAVQQFAMDRRAKSDMEMAWKALMAGKAVQIDWTDYAE